MTLSHSQARSLFAHFCMIAQVNTSANIDGFAFLLPNINKFFDSVCPSPAANPYLISSPSRGCQVGYTPTNPACNALPARFDTRSVSGRHSNAGRSPFQGEDRSGIHGRREARSTGRRRVGRHRTKFTPSYTTGHEDCSKVSPRTLGSNVVSTARFSCW